MPGEPVEPLFTPAELAQNEKRKSAMVELFVSHESVLFIGSGCSVRLKYPTWQALLVRLAELAHSILGGHLKTGHTWTLQNRPTEANQDTSIYNLNLGI